MGKFGGIAGISVAAAVMGALNTGARDVQSWSIRESVGHGWTNELVFFHPQAEPARGRAVGHSVVDETGRAVPFQIWRNADAGGRTQETVALQIDLPPYAHCTFTLRDQRGPVAGRGDVKVEREPGCFVLSAGRTAVKVARAESFKPGTAFDQLPAPIQTVKGVSGRWLGQGSLVGKFPVRKFTTEVEADGPLFAQVKVRYQFDDRKFYQVRVRTVSGEDVVLVEEDFRLSADELEHTTFVRPPDLAPELGKPSGLSDWLVNGGMGFMAVATNVAAYPCFRFNFFQNWEADRARKYDLGGATAFHRPQLAEALRDWRTGLVLEPYQARGLRVTAIGFDAEAGGKDYLGVFTRFLSRWEHVNENRVPLPWLEDGITAHFLAFEGRREWGILVDEPGDRTNDKAGKHGTASFGSIRQAQVKHGQTPLDKVKDWVLEWDLPAKAYYPRLYYTPESVARMKREFPKLPAETQTLVRQDSAAFALLTDNEAGLKTAFQSLGNLRGCVEAFLNGGHDTMDTYTHRYQEIVRHDASVLDLALASPSLSAEQRRQALAVVAFLAYKTSDPDYWAYHGYGGGPSNPNMMGIACHALASCAALCPGHPCQADWSKLCLRLVCADILMSIGPRGEWLESPGYQGAGNTPVNETVLILRNAGVADLVNDPVYGERLMAVSTYWANLLTPPDPRFKGKRMPMALGDNLPFRNNMFTYLAASGRDRYPEHAGHAVWAWEQMGRPSDPPVLLLNEHVLDGTISPVPIAGKTELFPGFGVMFRHGFGTPFETYLTYRQSDFAYGHYDQDQGSFSLFAKGAPLCLDWMDYSPDPAEYHNRVTYQAGTLPWLVPPPDVFTGHAEADYVRSHEAGLPPGATSMSLPRDAKAVWQRQCILVKDTRDPGAATYLVFRDTVASDVPSEWNVWTLARKDSEKITGNVARLEGQFGVDVSFFFYRPLELPLKTLFHHHQTKSGMYLDQDMTRVQAAAPKGGDFGVVLYPLRRGVDQEPQVRELPSGAVELKWPDGRRHLIFLFPEAKDVTESGLTFKGRAGVVKFEGAKPVLVPLECEFLR